MYICIYVHIVYTYIHIVHQCIHIYMYIYKYKHLFLINFYCKFSLLYAHLSSSAKPFVNCLMIEVYICMFNIFMNMKFLKKYIYIHI